MNGGKNAKIFCKYLVRAYKELASIAVWATICHANNSGSNMRHCNDSMF